MTFGDELKDIKRTFGIEFAQYMKCSLEDLPKSGYYYLGLVAIQALIVIIALIVNMSASTDADAVKYGVLFIISVLAMFFFAIDGTFRQNFITLVTFSFLALLQAVYAALSMESQPGTASLVQLIVCCVVIPFYAFLLYRLYVNFGWGIFQKLGANVQLRRLYAYLQVFISLVKFDVIYSILLLFSIFLYYSVFSDDYELYVDWVFEVFSLFWAFYGFYAMKNEISGRRLTAWFVFGIAQPIYALWKVLDFTVVAPPATSQKYAGIAKHIPFMSTLAIVYIVTRALLLIIAYKLQNNFGSGLAETISDDAGAQRERSATFVA